MTAAGSVAATASRWSTYQEAVFRDITYGRRHTVVKARAGSGKTSTIAEGVKRIPVGARTLMVAFNKVIERELSARVGSRAEVRTLHAFGFRSLCRAFGNVSQEPDKVRIILRELGYAMPREEWPAFRSVVSMAKATMAETPVDVLRIIDERDLDVPDDRAPGFAELVVRVLDECAARPRLVDFDDMVWLPLRLGLRLRGFDRVIIDETQDLNRAQLELALRACRDDGRVLAVGDDRQAIYAWRGADPDAIPNMIARMSASVLPLSVCYRCPRAVIEEAQRFVPDIEAAPGAREGVVEETTEAKLWRHARPGDMVLSRTNEPLLELFLQWLSEGRPAAIAGRDIGAGIAALIDKSNATTVDSLLDWLRDWGQQESARLLERGRDTSAAADRMACVRVACAGASTVAEVRQRIDRMFSDDGGKEKILLSSTHRAKGLEARRVWMLADTFRSFTRPGGSVEEDNLAYVAITRAREELRFVRDDRGDR